MCMFVCGSRLLEFVNVLPGATIAEIMMDILITLGSTGNVPVGVTVPYVRLPREHTHTPTHTYTYTQTHVMHVLQNILIYLEFSVSTDTCTNNARPTYHAIPPCVSVVMNRPEKYSAGACNTQNCCNFSYNLSRQVGDHSKGQQSHLCLGETAEEVAAGKLKLAWLLCPFPFWSFITFKLLCRYLLLYISLIGLILHFIHHFMCSLCDGGVFIDSQFFIWKGNLHVFLVVCVHSNSNSTMVGHPLASISK